MKGIEHAERKCKFVRVRTQEGEVSGNKFAHHILKRLVADCVNYFEVRGSEKQKLVDGFKLAGGKDYLVNIDKGDREVRLPRGDPKGYFPPAKEKRRRKGN